MNNKQMNVKKLNPSAIKNTKITSLTAVLLGLSSSIFAQTGNVGINTTSPTKTLDVNGQLRVRDLPIIPAGTPMVADGNGNIGMFKTVDPNDFILYNVDSNVRQNTSVNVPLTSILNPLQTNAQDGGSGTTIQPANCWVIPNSQVIFKFPAGSIRRGTATWSTWFEMAYGFDWSQINIIGGTGRIRLPLFFHSRAYARLYKKTGTTWSVVDVVTVTMQTTQISPYLQESTTRDNTGNLYITPGSTNQNFRYFLSAFYSIGDGTTVNVDPDSEYKVELLYGIENFSSRETLTNPGLLQNWGVQSVGYSFYKN
ncbi:hypothetical protein EGI15_22240 [Chryseobacterium cucumeris]|uniref:Outer membrane protein beta-barrel domain-containing protein n=1 Tax=Chryseobacterium cucumeris TaxID=1813611 RepID=A0ABX9X239_9FLAO|nr:hypothetical protein [Chryseobacterium cucumeris]ROH86562.1 hypothetical protein EGI15_22240 [Chryseobacterium cucumeris]